MFTLTVTLAVLFIYFYYMQKKQSKHVREYTAAHFNLLPLGISPEHAIKIACEAGIENLSYRANGYYWHSYQGETKVRLWDGSEWIIRGFGVQRSWDISPDTQGGIDFIPLSLASRNCTTMGFHKRF